MAVRARTKCFVGTSLAPTPEEQDSATAAAAVLFSRGFLPVCPHFYQMLGAEGEDYLHIRLTLLSECQSAVWVGQPTEVEAKACVDLGVVSRSIE